MRAKNVKQQTIDFFTASVSKRPQDSGTLLVSCKEYMVWAIVLPWLDEQFHEDHYY